jgi:hypothetical protein
MIAQSKPFPDNRQVIHLQIILINHRHVVQVKPDIVRLVPLRKLGHNSGWTASLKL